MDDEEDEETPGTTEEGGEPPLKLNGSRSILVPTNIGTGFVSEELTDATNEKMVNVLIADWARWVFAHFPFIVFEKWLEKDDWIARALFLKMGLGDSDDDKEQITELWITKNYKENFREKHRKRRNNLHSSIKTSMESK